MATATAPGVAVIRWNATWTPASLLWLETLGSAWPGVEVCTYTILDRYDQESRFSWKALQRLFGTAFTTGKLWLPIAAMKGSSVVEYESRAKSDGPPQLRISRVREEYEYVPLLHLSGADERPSMDIQPASLYPRVSPALPRVRNRRVARDFLEFLSTRRPVGVDEIEWDAQVRKRCDVTSVPGMGQFDIDGLSESSRSRAYDAGLVGFGVASSFVLALGVLLSVYVLQGEGVLRSGFGPGKEVEESFFVGGVRQTGTLRINSKGIDYRVVDEASE
eukprot:scaffold334_cov241-Pinguiococcus_pyrenoidosus.AAC.21